MNIRSEIRKLKADIVKAAYDKLKDTEEYQKRRKTMRLYMLCLETDMTQIVVMDLLKELGIEA